jgi:hypothetical protein
MVPTQTAENQSQSKEKHTTSKPPYTIKLHTDLDAITRRLWACLEFEFIRLPIVYGPPPHIHTHANSLLSAEPRAYVQPRLTNA